PVVFNAIRAVHPLTPILIFGGHTHIRDCQQYDGRSMALESGRYMETIGWMSTNLTASSGNLTLQGDISTRTELRMSITHKPQNSTFDTFYGRSITWGLQQLAVDFDLTYMYGTSPQLYTMNQPLHENDQLTAAPFTDSFLYLPNVTFSVANQVLPALNGVGAAKRKRDELEMDLWGRGYPWTDVLHFEERDTTNLTLGYVTTDGCPGAGDDTLHTALPILSRFPITFPRTLPTWPTTRLLISSSWTLSHSDVLSIVNGLQSGTNYTEADVSMYSPYWPTQCW
ncbi:hypothetical protein BU15DRAFT_69625, partial [Melanogaster broomeanus]